METEINFKKTSPQYLGKNHWVNNWNKENLTTSITNCQLPTIKSQLPITKNLILLTCLSRRSLGSQSKFGTSGRDFGFASNCLPAYLPTKLPSPILSLPRSSWVPHDSETHPGKHLAMFPGPDDR